MSPKELLETYSGRIVSVGDTFDHYRSSIHNESQLQYLYRTYEYWKHIEILINGNHDVYLLNQHFNPVEIYRERSVMAFHGHQLWFDFDLAKIESYEKKWNCETSSSSLFWDMEEWVVAKLNKYFQLDKKQAYVQAFKTLSCLNN